MSFFSRISSLFSRRSVQLTIVGVLAFFLLGPIGLRDHSIVYSGGVTTTWAAGEDAKKDKNATDEMVENMVAFLNIILGVITFLITPLVMLAGWLLSPDWTFGEIFGLRAVFHNIWILISNVVYVIFAFILVTIAFMNIFGGGHDHAYEIKKALPKLVVSILIVPFTWFIVSAVLSIANVLTASVIQLPVDMLGQTTNGNDILNTPMVPKNIVYNHGAEFNSGSYTVSRWWTEADQQNAAVTADGNFMTSDCSAKSNNECLTLKQFLTSGGGGPYNLVAAYAYGIFKVQDYKGISTDEQLKTTAQIVKKLIFGGLFFLIFGVLVIAIVYALFSRALMLWGFAMFSPLFALNYFFEHVKMGEKAKKSIDQFTISKFISLALVPVYVAAALAFGLMFVGSVVNMPDTSLQSDATAKIKPDGDTTTFTIGEVTLTTVWLITSSEWATAKGVLKGGGNIIGTVIVNVLALVILWMAVMAALKSDDITGAAVKPIADMGDELGKLMKSAPQYIPVFPGNQSMASISQWVSQAKSTVNTATTNKATEFAKTMGFGGAAEQTKAYNAWTNAIRERDYGGSIQGLHAMQKALKTPEAALKDGKFLDALRKTWAMPDIDLKFDKLDSVDDLTKAIRELDKKFKLKWLEVAPEDGTAITDDSVRRMFTGWSPVASNGARGATVNNIQITTPVAGSTTRNISIDGASATFDISPTTTASAIARDLNGLADKTTESALRNAISGQITDTNKVSAIIAELKSITGFFKTP